MTPSRSPADRAFRALLGCLVGAFALCCVMAVWSVRDAHPDEESHIAAGNYYTTRWLPPSIDAGTLRPSLSEYGVSYLGELDITYFLAGKVARVASIALPSEHLSFRAFNLLLFAGLIALYAARRSAFSPISFVLLTPQAWYTFSYFNNDALPLTLSLVTADALVGSWVARGDPAPAGQGRGKILEAGAWGALLGLLTLTKANYFFFQAFVGLLVLWRTAGLVPALLAVAAAGTYIGRVRGYVPLSEATATTVLAAAAGCTACALLARAWLRADVRPRIWQGALAATVGLSVVAPVTLYDRALNGTPAEKNRTLIAIRRDNEKLPPVGAASTPAAASSDLRGARLRAAGVSLLEVLLPPWSWVEKTWKSFTGYYGYMSISSPFAYYLGILLVYVAFAALLGRRMVAGGTLDEYLLAAIACGFAAATAGVSLYHSWERDFQAQGRYLFPMLAILALPFGNAAQRFDARDVRVFGTLFTSAFALGAFSFSYRGLRRIAKVTDAS